MLRVRKYVIETCKNIKKKLMCLETSAKLSSNMTTQNLTYENTFWLLYSVTSLTHECTKCSDISSHVLVLDNLLRK